MAMEKKKCNGWLDSLSKHDYLPLKLIASVVFVVVAAIVAMLNADYFWKVQDLSLFVASPYFLGEKMAISGGLLTYTGCFLTALFYYPWLGATVLIALLVALAWLVQWAFRLPGRWTLLAWIPSAMLMLSTVDLGYTIYTLKSPGVMFLNLLGVALAVAAYRGYVSLSKWWLRSVAAAMFVVVFYPLAGFYALLSVLLFVIAEAGKRGSHKGYVSALVAIVVAVATPWICRNYIYIPMTQWMTYWHPLPRFYEGEVVLYATYFVAFVMVALLAYADGRWKSDGGLKKGVLAASGLAFVASLFVMCYGYADDENFRVTMAMDRAINHNDWQQVTDLAAGLKSEPTRLIVLDTDMALFKMGRAGDEMFRYKISDKEYKVRRNTSVMRDVGARALYFQLGKINYCYRWCMEDKVEYGMRLEYLRYMVKCALLNGELELAKKYNNVLEHTLFNRELAAKFADYIANPSLIDKDPEFAAIRPLMAYGNMLEGDGGLLEGYLVSQIAYMEGGPAPLVELSLQCNLIQKDISRFWPRFMLYARTHDRLPVHYQEAAILYSNLEGRVDWRQFKIDDAVAQRFEQFMQTTQQYAGLPEERLATVFEPAFGDTFWYYYFFKKNLKTS